MKCPKCGYVSHDYLDACRKCSVDLVAFKAQMQLYAVPASQIDLRMVLGDTQPSPMASGEFELGDALFDSSMLVESIGEDGFDISLEDDFSFTPSAMSLESLDGFELSNVDSLSREASSAPAETDPGQGSTPPDTDYATVMLDISGMGDDPQAADEAPAIDAGSLSDEPIEAAVDTAELSIGPVNDAFETPIESAESALELPELTPDEMLIEPDLASADLSSSILGRTSDLDLTSIQLQRTTRDIEMLNQFQTEAEAVELEGETPDQISADNLVPDLTFDDAGEADDAEAIIPDISDREPEPLSDDILSAELAPDTTELAFPLIDEDEGEEVVVDDVAASLAPSLPGSFPDEPDEPENLNSESGELILPPMNTRSLASDITASPLSADESIKMPELPENAPEEEAMPSMFTEELSLPADMPELPSEFPSLQTGVFPVPPPEEATIVDEQSVQPPAIPDVPAEAPQPAYDQTDLELGDPDTPQQTDAFWAATPEEPPLADEPSPPLPIEPVAEHETRDSPETPFFPDLPEQADTFLAPSPEEATIVDEQPPPLPSHPEPTDAGPSVPDTGFVTMKLDLAGAEPPETAMFPDLPEQSDALLTPSPEEATIVDEQPPTLPSRQTPVDFTTAPPDTGYATVELDMTHVEEPGAPLLPDLPEQSDALLTPSPEEATIVDEQPPTLPGHPPLGGSTASPPDTGETTLELEIDGFDGELDDSDNEQLEFPNKPPQ